MKIFPVYVGNIAKDARVSDLRAVFGRFGNVLEVTVISEHGFVTYDSVEEASEAVRSLDGFQMCGKTLEVDYSDEMKAYFTRQNRNDRHVEINVDLFLPRKTRRSRRQGRCGYHPAHLPGYPNWMAH